MANPTYGRGFIDLVPRMDGGSVGGFKGSFVGSMGPIAAAAGAALAAGIGVALAAGVGLLKIGETFDDAFDNIRIGTGATGDALAGLEDSFRNVVQSVPTDFDDASFAIAELNTRLDLTGGALEDSSRQFLELSRITGGDLESNIVNTTRAFGDWGVAVEDQPARLDALFRASQATGIGVDDLSAQMVKSGAPMRQLGFGFEETAAIIGKFEKEGVNTELVLGSMRIALGKMARAGEDAPETFQRVTEEIANAGSASEANALALELFGARAGPDMAAAIREGRFDIDELYATIAGGSETILGAAAETNDWRESWQILKNQVLVGLEPLASAVFEGMGSAMEKLMPHVQAIATWLGENLPGAVATIQGWFGGLSGTTSGLSKTFGGSFASIAKAVTVGVGIVGDLLANMRQWFEENQETITKVMGQIQQVISTVIEIISRLWNTWGATIMALVRNAWSVVAGVISGALDVILGALDFFIGLFTGDWSRMGDGLLQVWDGLWKAIKSVLEGMWGQIQAVVANFPADLKQAGIDMVRGLWEGIQSMGSWLADKVGGFIKANVPGPIKSVLGIQSPSKVAAELGRMIPLGLVAGMEAEEPKVRSAASDMARATLPTINGTRAGLATVTPISDARGAGGLFDGATFIQQGTPEELARKTAHQIGIEVRAS